MLDVDPALLDRELLQLPREIRRVLDALPVASSSTAGVTADFVAFHLDQPIEMAREALWALRDQGLAQMGCGDDAVVRWSRA